MCAFVIWTLDKVYLTNVCNIYHFVLFASSVPFTHELLCARISKNFCSAVVSLLIVRSYIYSVVIHVLSSTLQWLLAHIQSFALERPSPKGLNLENWTS